MLLYAQDEIGYLSDAVIAEVADRIGITELDVRNVATYYSMLRFKPAGKYNVQVCTNISCMLRGAYDFSSVPGRSWASATRGDARRHVLAGRSGVHRRVLLGPGHPGQLRLPR